MRGILFPKNVFMSHSRPRDNAPESIRNVQTPTWNADDIMHIKNAQRLDQHDIGGTVEILVCGLLNIRAQVDGIDKGVGDIPVLRQPVGGDLVDLVQL